MDVTRRELLGTVAVGVGLSGCLGDGGSQPTDSPTASPTDSPTEAMATDSPTDTGMSGPTVGVRSHPDHGDILVGPDGMTLYMFDSDERGSGASTCSGGCLDNWPPLTVEGTPEAGDGVEAELTTFERDDGSMQVAANGWPLYYFTPDEEPGDAMGQGAGDVWWVLDPQGRPIKPEATETSTDAGMAEPTVQVRSHPDHGDILVGPDELTLYMFDSDEKGSGESACSGGCLDNWPPLTVDGEPEAGDGVTAALTTFDRGDGSTQVAANGWPLYYFTPDEEPGDANGQGAGDVWWVLDPAGAPVKPESTPITTTTSGGGGDGGGYGGEY